MLKWIALILVTSVLCWGDTARHSNKKDVKSEITDRIAEEQPSRPSRPVVKMNDDEIGEVGRAELEKLIENLDSASTTSGRKVGEQTEELN
ncbi:MAG: hypothetical protein EBR01_11000 [Proteobacteria bacterium]|nr:hypothetical protein [Pseudomonadota bacterium]